MKTLNELRAFCEGYRQALANGRDFYGNTMSTALDYVVWGGYDIHISGSEYSEHAKKDSDLHFDAYKADRTEDEAPLHSFTIFGETA